MKPVNLSRIWIVVASIAIATTPIRAEPIRVLFLGHESDKHNSDAYFPMLAKGLGREAIYFDYVTSVEEALGDSTYLNRFDVLLLYANHGVIEPHQWANLKNFVEAEGRGFVPVHSASWCFANEPGFDQLVGGRFKSHRSAVFAPRTVVPEHAAIRNVPEFHAWDETYVHSNHNDENRTVLQVREVIEGDPHSEPEPWTWVRTQGKGRVFYTASGHDERVWSTEGFQQLLRSGILWAVGDSRRESYEAFIASRTPLEYEKVEFIPNYENRPEPLPKQKPLSPEDSLSYTRVPVGWKLELFASEPEIINPIHMAWDERGRLWVAETTDYPNEVREDGGNDKIKILEDTNGDGKCDKATVFADGLNIPTSLTFSNGGIIIAQAPHFLFLKDTNGDDKADVKEVLFSGWGIRDTHAGPSNLRYGLDNQIWGAVGYSGFDGGGGNSFRSGIFRFKPDGSEIEFVAQFNNNTWGLGMNEDGDVFGSTANRNAAFFCGLPARLHGDQKGMSAKMIADNSLFHPITPNIRQVDAIGEYTAGAGFAFANSAGFPESWRGKSAFICGPTGNLLGRFQSSPENSGFKAANQFALVASADEWFSPVAAEVGADGNLWIADWYNFIIQHNPVPRVDRGGFAGENGKGNAHVNPNRDQEHGRIYRLVWEGARESTIQSLVGADSVRLVAALGDSNQFWRKTAQRLLVERQDSSETTLNALRAMVKQSGPQAIHALWTLRGLGQLDRETHQVALLSKSAALKRNAIKALGTDSAALQLFFDTAVVADKNPRTRLVAFTKLAEFTPRTETVSRAASELLKMPQNAEDEWLNLALRAAGGLAFEVERFDFGQNLFPNPSFEKMEGDQPLGWRPARFKGQADHTVSTEARTGKHSLQISSVEGADAGWFTILPVKPGTDYELSGWVKTKDVRGATGALMNVHGHGQDAATNRYRQTHDWKRARKVINSRDKTQFNINLLFGGWGKSTGTAFWDDVSLREVIPVYRKVEETEVTGDVERGRKVFHEHQVAACIRCHVVGGEGGPIGPPLDGIASRKAEDYLRESLSDPQATMAEGFPAEVSPMPPMSVLLKKQEFEDVMAFLMTLK